MSSNSGSGRDRNSEMPTEKKGKAEKEAHIKAEPAKTLQHAQKLSNELDNDDDAPEPTEILETTASDLISQGDEEDDLVKKNSEREPESTKNKGNSGKAHMSKPTNTTSHAHHKKQNLAVSPDFIVTDANLTEKVGAAFSENVRGIARRKRWESDIVEILVRTDALRWLKRTVVKSDFPKAFEDYERAKKAGDFKKVSIPKWHEVQILESVSLDTDVNSGVDGSSDDDPLRDEKDESVLQGSEDDEPAGVEEQDSLVADAENETEPDQAARDAAESSSGVESQGSEQQLVSEKVGAAAGEKETRILSKIDQGDEAVDKASGSKHGNKRGSAAPTSKQPPEKKRKSAKTTDRAEKLGEDEFEGTNDVI
ncbi:unnamed protein product [Alternaria sp. RS040]